MAFRALRFEPAFVLLAAAAVLAGVAAVRRKSGPLIAVFVGMLVLVGGIGSLELTYSAMEHPHPEIEPAVRALFKCAEWMPILAGAFLVAGFAWLAAQRIVPNHSPDRMPGTAVPRERNRH